MTGPEIAPYGAWRSPLSAGAVARGGVRLLDAWIDGDRAGWNESRPTEGGRSVLVAAGTLPGAPPVELLPPGRNARTLVHEYGGGAQLVRDGVVFFSDFGDQRLYRQDPGGEPFAITPAPAIAAGDRYADFALTPDGRTLLCVAERHVAGVDPSNEIVAVPADGSGEPRVVASGSDFVAFPRVSPDGRRLAWIAWDHPAMPWDGTRLQVAPIGADGAIGAAETLAGGPGESVFQPAWAPDGTLHFVSDRTGWWNLYAWRDGGAVPLAPREAEFGAPLWVFGLSTYDFLADGTVVCVARAEGRDRLALIRPGGPLEELATPFTTIGSLHASGDRVVCIAASGREAPAVVEARAGDWEWRVHRRSAETALAPADISEPRPIAYPAADGWTAHALFYAPRNSRFRAPDGERPPLLVLSHGGPTSHASNAFQPAIQFWTSRGFAVVDVDYGGSTGYGRAYRERLRGAWGVVDTADCIDAARFLARDEVDGARMAIRGGSAGGYTTLCALTFHDVFAAGASYYGVADAEALAADTHKFESRYLDSLIGPYPEQRALYRERSPIHAVDRLSCPVILFQGLEDRVVPPEQSEMMVEALRAKGLPVAYLAFEGEQHGFRRAETIERALEAELAFYGRVLGFEPADEIAPLPMDPA